MAYIVKNRNFTVIKKGVIGNLAILAFPNLLAEIKIWKTLAGAVAHIKNWEKSGCVVSGTYFAVEG